MRDPLNRKRWFESDRGPQNHMAPWASGKSSGLSSGHGIVEVDRLSSPSQKGLESLLQGTVLRHEGGPAKTETRTIAAAACPKGLGSTR